MKNSIKIFFLLFLIMAFLSSCSSIDSDSDETNYVTYGTVKYIELEGGFYGIFGDDGETYDPVNLPHDFQVDDLRIWFQFIILNDQASIHQWGTLIEIVSVERLN